MWTWLIALMGILPGASGAGGFPTLAEVCGRQTNVASGKVLTEKCLAAYAAGNASLVQHNNTYVHGAAAIVCTHGCLSGGLNSCGAGSGACSGARALARKAISDDRGSADSFKTAQRNGTDALSLIQAETGVKASLSGLSGVVEFRRSAPQDYPSPPAACAEAARSRDAQSRIACAAVTDSSLPEFVATEQFAADFKAITGHSLEDAFRADFKTLLAESQGALTHAYGTLKGRYSFQEFLETGMALAEGLQSETRGKDFAGTPNSQLAALEKVGATAGRSMSDAGRARMGLGRAPAVREASDDELASTEAEDREGMNIFQRVSLGYRKAIRGGRMDEGWGELVAR
jgi:hypothetical protein